jgi:hypothetical protein
LEAGITILYGFAEGALAGEWGPAAYSGETMDLNHWADDAWKLGSFEPEAWGGGDAPQPPVPEPDTQERPSGGYYVRGTRQRTEEDERRGREAVGIPQPVAEVIANVAARQAEKPADEHKRFEELERELALRGLEWQGRYLAALNVARERLARQDEEAIVAVLLATIATD